MEDTSELLSADARERTGQGLSRFLNVVDGLIGQGLRVIVLVTTNEEIKLHPAVARPGRCAANMMFDALSREGIGWLSAHGVDEESRGGARSRRSTLRPRAGPQRDSPGRLRRLGDARLPNSRSRRTSSASRSPLRTRASTWSGRTSILVTPVESISGQPLVPVLVDAGRVLRRLDGHHPLPRAAAAGPALFPRDEARRGGSRSSSTGSTASGSARRTRSRRSAVSLNRISRGSTSSVASDRLARLLRAAARRPGLPVR